MYVDLGTGVRRSKDVPRITYVLKSALVPDLLRQVTFSQAAYVTRHANANPYLRQRIAF